MIRPSGVVSKNDIGDRRIALRRSKNNRRDAAAPPSARYSVLIYAKKTAIIESPI